MMRAILKVVLLTCCFSAQAGNVSKNSEVLSPNSENDKKELVTMVAALLGTDVDPNDPEALQAAEGFLVSDAAKAYAFTKIHAVPLEFCPDNEELANALLQYEASAKGVIALGQYYYAHGIDLVIGEQRMTQSGDELEEKLDGMLDGIRREFEGADRQVTNAKCDESIEALRMLARMYGG